MAIMGMLWMGTVRMVETVALVVAGVEIVVVVVVASGGHACG